MQYAIVLTEFWKTYNDNCNV